MTIRNANETDISEIIGLMRSSLGESLLPKSEQLWRWKHSENPFGKSFVLVGEEENRLIGLRAFMQWQWVNDGKIYKAIRAVDTATHPNHQGKGIFKKLTLQQLALCKDAGIDFVFNTPNAQSMPGYLKMDWKLQGKMPMKICFRRPAKIAYNKLKKPNKYVGIKEDPTPIVSWDGVAALLRNNKQLYNGFHTNFSPEYIEWRYANNPLYRYQFFTDNSSYLAIGRVKYQSFMKEYRITDFFPLADKVNHIHFREKLNAFCKSNEIDFISMSGNHYLQNKGHHLALGLFPVKNIGPAVTIRDLNVTPQMPSLLNAKNWQYTLGDMELF